MIFSRVVSVIVLGLALATAACLSNVHYFLMNRGDYLCTVGFGIAFVILVLASLLYDDACRGLFSALLGALGAPLLCLAVFKLGPGHWLAFSGYGLMGWAGLLLLLAACWYLVYPSQFRSKPQRVVL